MNQAMPPVALVPLVNAFKQGNFQDVQRILEEGCKDDIDLNQPIDDRSRTLLHLACGEINSDIAHLLIQHGASVNVTDEYGYAPLLLACRSGFSGVDLVKLLVDKGADVQTTTGRLDVTPLHFAINSNIAKLLLDSGASVDSTNNQGETPLFNAIYHDRCDVVEALIERGANTMIRDKEGKTPLHRATFLPNTDIARILIEKGKADVDALGTGENFSPLMEACFCVNFRAIRLLIQHGVNVKATNFLKETALHVAARSGNVEIVEMLIENGADVNAEASNGDVPSLWGVRNPEVVAVLVRHGATDEFVQLMSAIYKGNCSKIQDLIDGGTDVNICRRSFGHLITPMTVACEICRIEHVKLLLKAGAAVNGGNYSTEICNTRGSTCSCRAAGQARSRCQG